MAKGKSSNVYGRQGGNRMGQGGQSYPLNPGSSNPLQDVRDIYRQPQEVAYKMQPGRFMPAQNPHVQQNGVTDDRAIIRDGGYVKANQNFDIRAQSFDELDTNYRTRWIQA